MDNLISRQAAIEYFMTNTNWHDEDGYEIHDAEDKRALLKSYFDGIPPAQPEPLTDKEQRIFLAAMGREEKVCKQTDEECRDCREPYEDSLVYVCKEIVRKVKGALWQT